MGKAGWFIVFNERSRNVERAFPAAVIYCLRAETQPDSRSLPKQNLLLDLLSPPRTGAQRRFREYPERESSIRYRLWALIFLVSYVEF